MPAQGAVARFPENRMTHRDPAELMMRNLAGKETPEPEYLRERAALCGPSINCKIFGRLTDAGRSASRCVISARLDQRAQCRRYARLFDRASRERAARRSG